MVIIIIFIIIVLFIVIVIVLFFSLQYWLKVNVDEINWKAYLSINMELQQPPPPPPPPPPPLYIWPFEDWFVVIPTTLLPPPPTYPKAKIAFCYSNAPLMHNFLLNDSVCDQWML